MSASEASDRLGTVYRVVGLTLKVRDSMVVLFLTINVPVATSTESTTRDMVWVRG